MTREIYEAMKRRMEVITKESNPELYKALLKDYKERGWSVPKDGIFYRFKNDGLNDGLDLYDEDTIDSIIQPWKAGSNIWNVCHRFYSFIQHYPNINERLLWKHDA